MASCGMQTGELWLRYLSIGGSADKYEVVAYMESGLMSLAAGWRGSVGISRKQQGQRDHPDAKDKVEPVVRIVDGHQVCWGVVPDDEPVDPEDEVDNAAVQQEVPGLRAGARHQEA